MSIPDRLAGGLKEAIGRKHRQGSDVHHCWVEQAHGPVRKGGFYDNRRETGTMRTGVPLVSDVKTRSASAVSG